MYWLSVRPIYGSFQHYLNAGNGTTNGSLIQTWTYAGNPNEEWEAVSLGNGYYNFVGQGSGLCLDTPSASTANGVQLDIYTCNGTAAQAWKLVVP